MYTHTYIYKRKEKYKKKNSVNFNLITLDELEFLLLLFVVMRVQGSLRVVLNTKVWSGMSVERQSEKSVRLTAFDPQGVKVFLVMVIMYL